MKRIEPLPPRPGGVTALALFFAAGSAIAALSLVSLADPGGFLEPMWRLNPRARTAFAGMGGWGLALLGAVCLACGAASAGLWRARPWGRRLAIALIAVDLAGNVANAISGVEPRALVGVPVAAAILAYLWTGRVRGFFASPAE